MTGGGVILPGPKRLPARHLILAPVLPAKPKVHTGNPFTSDGDIVWDCDTLVRDPLTGAETVCGYHAYGPRSEVRAAIMDHRRQYHPESMGVYRLNAPR